MFIQNCIRFQLTCSVGYPFASALTLIFVDGFVSGPRGTVSDTWLDQFVGEMVLY